MSEWQDDAPDAIPGAGLRAPAQPEIVLQQKLHRARSAFLSQLIAERLHLPAQRERRRETPAAAIGSYAQAAAGAERRLPPGYRKSLSA